VGTTFQGFVLLGEKAPADAQCHNYRAREAISAPYSVEVDFSTADATFRVDDLLNNRMQLAVTDGQGTLRHYDGLPDRVGFSTFREDRFFFHLRLRPAIAALEHREGSRIFQEQSPVDVVKEIMKEAGVDGDVEWRLTQSYAPRDFLCQYRESELDFVHRLLEEEGIFYFFLHSENGHKLVFADDPAAFSAHDALEPVVFGVRQGVQIGSRPVIDFRRRRRLRPGSVLLRDYDFEAPDAPPAAALPATEAWPIPHFEYPGGFTADAEGQRRARARISELRRDADVTTGSSRSAGLACGTPFTVEGAREECLNGEFIISELRAHGEATAEACINEFTAIPKDAPFSAPRRAKKPKIRGIQTAVVTGPTNEPEAIHVDKYGRIKVRFLWDRSGKVDDTASFWIRVSQLGLGGSMILPRVGWEVSVAFLDGDPDRPIVLGRSYNGEYKPPYAQPGAAADGSLKSAATPGGAGHNEIKMGDSAGSQGFSMSAKKDLNVSSGNDKNETVGVDEDHSVGSNYKVVIGSNETTTVSGSQSIDVGNALQVKAGSQTISVGGSEDMHAKCDYIEKVGGTRDYEVTGNQITISCGVRQQIKGAFKRDVGAVQANVSLASIDDNMLATFDETASAAIVHLVMGMSAETVAADKNLTSLAAELHMVSAITTSAKGVKQLIGGVHLRKVAGDFVVQAPKIVIGGGVGKFKGGGSQVTLNGGPVTLKGSAIAFDAAAIAHLASTLKIG
jgi:type VI secretion system secreted protein VgrG